MFVFIRSSLRNYVLFGSGISIIWLIINFNYSKIQKRKKNDFKCTFSCQLLTEKEKTWCDDNYECKDVCWEGPINSKSIKFEHKYDIQLLKSKARTLNHP